MTQHEPTSDELQPKDAPASAASKLFDLRVLIGALFTFYGVALSIYGLFFTSPAEIAKAAGININLWLGLGMLALGLLFLLWAKLAPVVHDPVLRRPRTARRCTDSGPLATTTLFTGYVVGLRRDPARGASAGSHHDPEVGGQGTGEVVQLFGADRATAQPREAADLAQLGGA